MFSLDKKALSPSNPWHVCVRARLLGLGTDGTTSHITLPCDSDFRVGDVVNLFEEDGGNLDSAYTASTFALTATVGGAVQTFGSHVAGSGYTSGSHVVDLLGGSGTGARARVTIAGGEVTSAQLLSAGSGYHHSDQLTFNLPGGGSGFAIEVGDVSVADAAPFTLTDYYVVGAGTDSDGHPWIELSASEGGTAITVTGDGGTGSADNDLPAHINIKLSEWFAVCGVREFSLDISRDELDVTTLPAETAPPVATPWLHSAPPKRATPRPPAPCRVLHLRPRQHRQPPPRRFS